MSVWLTATITQSNKNAANNTSLATVTLVANWNGGSWAADNPAGYIIIDSTRYDFTSNFNTNNTTTGSQTIAVKSKTVNHNADGSKTVYCSAAFDGTGIETVYWSASKIFEPIARTSLIGTLDEFDLEKGFSVPITKYSSDFSDTLMLVIGATTIKTIDNYIDSTFVTLTNQELIAAYNAMGVNNSASAAFKVTTKKGSEIIGTSPYSYTTAHIAGTVKINITGEWKSGILWMKVGGIWKRAVINVKSENGWERGI